MFGHAANVEIFRGAGPEERVPDGARAIVVGGVAGARNHDVHGVRHE